MILDDALLRHPARFRGAHHPADGDNRDDPDNYQDGNYLDQSESPVICSR
jgi:hypothetical protein